LIGLKILKGFWAEGFATFGELENYYEKNAYLVYNIPDKILFKWGLKILYRTTHNFDLTLSYENLYRENLYTSFVYNDLQQPVLTKKTYTYNNYILIGGIKWNF
jgi:hypothetical protein